MTLRGQTPKVKDKKRKRDFFKKKKKKADPADDEAPADFFSDINFERSNTSTGRRATMVLNPNIDPQNLQNDTLETLNCEIQRLNTLLEYKEYELSELNKKQDFGFECFSGLRKEFDEKMKNL